MLIIDRIENGFAVASENGIRQDIPLNEFDDIPKEGDVLTRQDGKWTTDCDKTAQRKKLITEKQDSLWE
ncbi:MAG: DUF3006 domain-containing protein [Oscillospiraceae bacterium]|nr:DUF3006 domain-containing protein [Oscillospiraceae bacterium]